MDHPDAEVTGREPEQPLFERVSHGYHMPQVDDYIRRLLARLHEAELALVQPLERDAAAAVHSPAARQMIDELMRMALDEIMGQKAAAQQEADQLLASAREMAAQISQEATSEADTMVAGAREQSATLLNDARASARSLLAKATARAEAVTEAGERRLTALITTHEQTLARLAEISSVTTRLGDMERERGSLRDEVDRAVGEAPAVAASAPAQLTAAAEQS
jgi:cell division septum initiation protein DivIVA